MYKKSIRCCFAGHNHMYNDAAKDLMEKTVELLIIQHNVNEFWVGNYGTFDSLAARTVRTLKEKYSNIQLILCIPYVTQEMNDNKEFYYKNYDSILVADVPLSTPKSLYIIKANEYMVDYSDFFICWIDHTWGGAFKTYGYAKRKKLQIYNIADKPI